MRFNAPARHTGWIERPDCRLAYQRVGAGPPLVFEPPRVRRRPQLLRGWGYDKEDIEPVFA